MRRALQKIVVLLLAVGLTASGPISSHACIDASSPRLAHKSHAVQTYGDLAIDPGENECPHAAPSTTHNHDDGACNKCCAACVGASLLPTVPAAALGLSVARDALTMRHDVIIARPVPTEPGIPKPI
jgi:hypothetical protein